MGSKLATAKLEAAIQAHVPMKPAWFQILVAIATGHSHGYAIRQAVEKRTEGRIQLWPATLYGTLRQLREAGLVEEQELATDARRKRSFVLTEVGRAVLDGETRRLERLVQIVRTESVLAR